MLHSHNVAVFNAARILVIVLALLTGCKTSAPQREKALQDWDIAPPPAPAPASSAPTNAPAPPPEPESGWIPLQRWSAQRGIAAPVNLGVSSIPTFALSLSNNVFVFQAGSLTAHWNGLQLWLGFTPLMIDGQMYLHSLDLQKNIQPLVNRGVRGGNSNRVIVIDPGHGGGNTGAQSIVDGRFEKEFTLDWALRLAPLLEQRCWQVFLTRTNDAEVPLGDRVTFAGQHKPDFFLSLHFNASPNGRQQAGIETYCLTPAGMYSSLTREFDDDPALAFPNNAFDVQNLQYAARLHRALLEINGNVDRGLRRARFMGVLRGQNRPAVLLEGGYLSNPAEARRIADPEFRQKLAEAVAKALE